MGVGAECSAEERYNNNCVLHLTIAYTDPNFFLCTTLFISQILVLFVYFLLLFLRSNVGMVMLDLDADVLDELGSCLKFLLGSPQLQCLCSF